VKTRKMTLDLGYKRTKKLGFTLMRSPEPLPVESINLNGMFKRHDLLKESLWWRLEAKERERRERIRRNEKLKRKSPHDTRIHRVRNKIIKTEHFDDEFMDFDANDGDTVAQTARGRSRDSINEQNVEIQRKMTTLRANVFEQHLTVLPCKSNMLCISCSASSLYCCIDCNRIPVYYCKTCAVQKCSFLHRIFDVNTGEDGSDSLWVEKILKPESCVYCGQNFGLVQSTAKVALGAINVITAVKEITGAVVHECVCHSCGKSSGDHPQHHGFYGVFNTWVSQQLCDFTTSIRLEGGGDITDRAVARAVLARSKQHKLGMYEFRQSFVSDGGSFANIIGLALQLDSYIKRRVLKCDVRGNSPSRFSCMACAQYGCRAHMDGTHLFYIFISIFHETNVSQKQIPRSFQGGSSFEILGMHLVGLRLH
jgi:hypothetical protein